MTDGVIVLHEDLQSDFCIVATLLVDESLPEEP